MHLRNRLPRAIIAVALLTGLLGPTARADQWRRLDVQLNPATPPAGRLLQSAIFDAANRRMIVYGGLANNDAYSDVWELRLDGNAHWTEIVPGMSPTPPHLPAPHRRNQLAVLDTKRNRMVIFGGCTTTFNESCVNDVWAFDLGANPNWTKLAVDSASGPSPRFGGCGIYDPQRDRMVFFGGSSELQDFRNETWALSLSTLTWTRLALSGPSPSPRNALSAIYDPLRDRMLIFGGWDGTNHHNDVWALSLSGTPAWSQVVVGGGAPTGRRHPAVIYDSTRDAMVINGGYDTDYRNDTWQLSLAGTPMWTQLSIGGSLPVRNAHSAIYDPVGDQIVMFGGYGMSVGGWLSWLGDTWAASLDTGGTWVGFDVTNTIPGGPPTYAGAGARRNHVAVLDADGDRMIVHGGYQNGSGMLNDTWSFSLTGDPSWAPIYTPNGWPSARFGHAGAMDTARRRMLIFGGWDGHFRNDVWGLSLSGTPTWTLLDGSDSLATNKPAARNATGAVYDPALDRLLVFGGWSGVAMLGDLWAFDCSGGTPHWTELHPTGTPPAARRNHATTFDPATRRLYVTAGTGLVPPVPPDTTARVVELADTWICDFTNSADGVWTLEHAGDSTATPAPSPRDGSRAVVDALGRLVEFGGVDGIYHYDAWAFDPGTVLWTKTVPDTALHPEGRVHASMIYDVARSRSIVYGGETWNNLQLADVWELRTEAGGGTTGPPIVGVPGGGAVALALSRVAPNPSHGAFDVVFTLPRRGEATLALYDVRGRAVASQALNGLSAGANRVRLAAPAGTRSGVYFLVLSQDGASRRQRVILFE